MDENISREEILEELENGLQTEVEERSYDLPAEPELEGGFDLKSALLGAGVFSVAALITKYGPKASGWVKRHLSKKKEKQEDDKKKFDTSDAEDADFKEVNDSDEETPEKK